MKINPYLKLDRIEFVMTRQCTGRCKHCSAADSIDNKTRSCVAWEQGAKAIEWLARHYPIQSMMTFGGEPLLYWEAACALHQTAKEQGIPLRQMITNGYFTKNEDRIDQAARAMAGLVTDTLVSVDAFHQEVVNGREVIPLHYVRLFMEKLLAYGAGRVRLSPAWVVNREHSNPWNERTEEILGSLADLRLEVASGNDIFLAGNAQRYLSQYYPASGQPDLSVRCGEAPYTDRLDQISSLSIEPDGSVIVCAFVIGNIYRESMEAIVERYDPYTHPYMSALLSGGVAELMTRCENLPDLRDCSTACSICHRISRSLTGVR